MNRYFELIDPVHNHRKFWEIIISGTTVNVHFGRIGTAGQIQVKTFPTVGQAEAHVQKLVHEKRNKGYVEKIGGSMSKVHQPLPKAVPAPSMPVQIPKMPVLPPTITPMPARRMKITRRQKPVGEDDE